MGDLDTITAALDAQSKELAALKDEVGSLRAPLAEVTQQLDSLPPLLDPRTIETEVDAIRSSQSALLRKQRAFVEKATSQLQDLRSSTTAEIKSIKSLIESLKSSISAPKKDSPPPAESPKPAKKEESPSPKRPAPPPEQPKTKAKPKTEPKGKVDLDGITLCEYPFNADRPFDGIIAAMTAQCGGNVEDKGIVQAISSSCLDPNRFAPKNISDLMFNSNFVSENKPEQWIAYDFKSRKVGIKGYAIRSRFDGWPNSSNPKSWVVEVSDDQKLWIEADWRANNFELNGTNLWRAFPSKRQVYGQFIRLKMTGPSHANKDILAIAGFEVFGDLTD
jgi:hypothetical protein